MIHLYFLLIGVYMYIYLLLCLMLNFSIQSSRTQGLKCLRHIQAISYWFIFATYHAYQVIDVYMRIVIQLAVLQGKQF